MQEWSTRITQLRLRDLDRVVVGGIERETARERRRHGEAGGPGWKTHVQNKVGKTVDVLDVLVDDVNELPVRADGIGPGERRIRALGNSDVRREGKRQDPH